MWILTQLIYFSDDVVMHSHSMQWHSIFFPLNVWCVNRAIPSFHPVISLIWLIVCSEKEAAPLPVTGWLSELQLNWNERRLHGRKYRHMTPCGLWLFEVEWRVNTFSMRLPKERWRWSFCCMVIIRYEWHFFVHKKIQLAADKNKVSVLNGPILSNKPKQKNVFLLLEMKR